MEPMTILDQAVPGLHRYVLEPEVRLDFVSGNLANMLGYSTGELLSGHGDGYRACIYTPDLPIYDRALDKLRRSVQTTVVEYRLIRKDGTILYVQDTMTSMVDNGVSVCVSVLTDITDLKQQSQELEFLNSTIHCGFLKLTCERAPKVTYANHRMLDILRFPKDPVQRDEIMPLYTTNALWFVHSQERQLFLNFLDKVYTQGGPILGELTILCHDGTSVRVMGWGSRCCAPNGTESFHIVCMDVTEQYRNRINKERQRYINALTDVYEKIFEIDFPDHTVKCIHSSNSLMFRWTENIPMKMGDATQMWIGNNIDGEDQQWVWKYFTDFFETRHVASPVIRYHARSSDGVIRPYSGIILKIDDATSLFCTRRDPQNEEKLRTENQALKVINENMQSIVMRFTEGITAFEIVGECVTPLFAHENLIRFFGFTQQEWAEYMKHRTPIREFISRCGIAYKDFSTLVEQGEMEFNYFDLVERRTKRMRAVRSEMVGTPPRFYIMLHSISEVPAKADPVPRVHIRTFGHFDVFVDGKPIAFRNKKAMELLALLTDRRGGFITSEEAIAYLWEDAPADSVTLSRYRKVALRLKSTLEEYGVADILEAVSGKRRLVPEKVRCDLFDCLAGDKQLFKGTYMANYSWGEATLAELTGRYLSDDE